MKKWNKLEKTIKQSDMETNKDNFSTCEAHLQSIPFTEKKKFENQSGEAHLEPSQTSILRLGVNYCRKKLHCRCSTEL